MSNSSYTIEDLIHLMSRLREPETGCPWDLKQDYRSITSSTIEEAYEVVDAIEREDYGHLKEELGDLLFQVIFYSQLADEEKRFDFMEIVHTLTAKLVRRHPHVFPEGTLASRRDPNKPLQDSDIKASWEAIKASERREKGNGGLLDDVPRALPAMTRALKLQKRAAKVGFDWPEAGPVLEKIKEEITELEQAHHEANTEHMEEELGDLLFTCVNYARHLDKDPELLLRRANEKFEMRFRGVEESMRVQGRDQYTIEELEAFWQNAKKAE